MKHISTSFLLAGYVVPLVRKAPAEKLTLRQAAYLVASEEIARAKDWEYALWSNPKVPRSAVYKAKLEVHAAEMRAARILRTPILYRLPAPLRAAIESKLKSDTL